MKLESKTHWHRRHVLRGASLLAMGAALPLRADSAWREAPPLPLKVQEIYPALHENDIWVAGGLMADPSTGAISISDHVVRYAINDGRWHAASSLPTPRHHGFLVSLQAELLLFGGFTAGNGGIWHAKRDVLRLGEAGWSTVGELPTPQSETVTAIHAGRVHLAGGRAPLDSANAEWTDQSDIATHHIFDPVTGNTELGEPLPMARNSAASFVIGDDWHVVGGRTVGGGNTDRHDIYSFSQRRWREGAPMPQAQGGLAAASVDQAGFVFGGEFFSADGGGVYSEVWRFDATAEQWSKAGVMPAPRHGLGAVATGGAIHVIGGALGAGGNGTSDRMSVFQP